MRLNQFIKENIESILVEWESFARTMIPPAETMSVIELRDHAHEILLAIAGDMESMQSEAQREAKSKGLAEPRTKTFASVHGTLRQRVGFDLSQLSAEYRALRASVLRLWMARTGTVDASVLEEVVRFNEAIDQSLAEAMLTYSEHMATSRDTFLAVLGHDLRSPLGALSSCVHLLGRTVDGKPNERALRVAKQSIASISEMITDLLEYTRTRLGRGIEVLPQQGDLSAVCEEVFDQICAAYPARKFKAEIEPKVSLDAAKIHAGIARGMEFIRERGWLADLCLVPPDASASAEVRQRLQGVDYDCVVIGGGIRLPPSSLALFEMLVNAVHASAPAAAIAFNTTPLDTADAVARVIAI